MILLFAVFIIFFILIIGYSAINLFDLDLKSQIEKLCYSWGLGVGLIGIQLFSYSIVGIEWSRFIIILPWIGLILFSFWRNKPKFKIKIEKLDRVEKIFIIFIFSLLCFTAIEAIIRPVQAWDSWSNWLFRAKVFFLNNNVSLEYVKFTGDEYPQIIPLMSTFYYKLIGQIADKEVLLLFFTFYLVIAGLFYAKSKEIIGRKWALVFTFLLISTQNLIRHGGRFEVGQADLPLAFFILASACLLLIYLKSKNLLNLIFFNIFLGLTALIKNDGIPIFLIGNILTIYFVVRSRDMRNLVAIIPSIILFGFWNLYKYVNDYPMNPILGSGKIHYNEFASIVAAMFKEFLNIQNWNLIWIFFIFCLLFYYKNIKKIWPIFLLFATQWFFYLLAFIFSPYTFAVDHVTGITDRLYIHITPLALLITVLLISQINLRNINKKNKSF